MMKINSLEIIGVYLVSWQVSREGIHQLLTESNVLKFEEDNIFTALQDLNS